MIWGWIIGAVILGIIVLTFAGIGLYAYMQAKDAGERANGTAPPKAATAGAWDGKSTFECKGNDVITLTGVKVNGAGTAIRASGNCTLTLSGVDITAPIAIDANNNAKVTMTGGSIKASTNSVVAAGVSKVTLVGTTVSGKSKATAGAKIVGAP